MIKNGCWYIKSGDLAGSARVCHSGLFTLVSFAYPPCSSGLNRASDIPPERQKRGPGFYSRSQQGAGAKVRGGKL